MHLTGSLLVALAAICFGFMGLFGSWATDTGVSVEMMLFLRFAIAGAIMIGIMVARRLSWPRGRVLLALIGMGAALYVGEAMFWFHAARHIPRGLVSLLLYIYPVIVTLMAWLVLGERLTRGRLIALGLACAGLGLTIGPIIMRDQPPIAGSRPVLGVVLGLLCCLSYSIYILVGGGVTRKAGAVPGATVVILSAAAALGSVALVRGDAWPVSTQAWSGIACLAIFSTVIAITAVLYGLERIGPVRTSTISTLEPVVTIIVGAAFMHESLSGVQAIGGGLIVVAAVMVARGAPNGVKTGSG